MDKDKLEHMLELQRDLQVRYTGVDPSWLMKQENRKKDAMQYIRTMVLALEDELHEAMNETGWKPWASSDHINTKAFKGELVDAFHFFMNLMLVVDMSAEELYHSYLKKQKKNHKRIDNGYDGVTDKCPLCKRAYDDEAVKCKPACKIDTTPVDQDIFVHIYTEAWCEERDAFIRGSSLQPIKEGLGLE